MTSSPIPKDLMTQLLAPVEKPARYLGNEVNAVVKDLNKVEIRVALVFPDAYEIGESHMGLKILYKILNDQPHIWAERVYAPWIDMEASLRRHQVPLFSLESRTPLGEFDVIGITLPYELVYSNILTMLDLGGVPLRQSDRGPKDPVVIGGGTCSFNPEPIAEFFDAIVVGDGEDLILPLVQEAGVLHRGQGDREAMLTKMARHPGVYVPSFFEVDYDAMGRVQAIKPKYEEFPGVLKATVTDLNGADYPTAPVVPNVKVVHDRVGVEVQRGCVRACRFCQAGYIYRPERQRSPERVQEIVDESLKNTGLEEVSLLSLSVGDYQPLNPLLNQLFDRHEKDRVAISLPATRTETLTPEIIQQIKRVRKTGFTIAPEAGSPRMRRIINKGNERDDLMKTVEHVFEQGWRLIKFYYMCGLPLETEEDVKGIAEEARQAYEIGRKYTKAVRINVSVSSFVPKPFTPFQWEPQLKVDEVHRLHHLLREELRGIRGIQFKHHNSEMSYLEGVFSRGDRRLAAVVQRAYEMGARFDEWEEQLDFKLWQEAFRQCGLDPDFYVTRRRDRNEILPWDHLFTQMKKDFLWEEWEAAHDLAFAEDCSTHRCADCGVCDFRQVLNVNYQQDGESGEVHAHSTRGRKLKNHALQPLAPSPQASVESAEKSLDTQCKLRVKYTKLGEAAYLSHLDLMTVLRRALARAKIPIGFSKGFHPQMLMSMGPALSLGHESEAEFLDVALVTSMAPELFRSRMNAVLPKGVEFLEVWEVPQSAPSLNGTLQELSYDIELQQGAESRWNSPSLEHEVATFNSSDTLPILRKRSKKTKTIDIRPMIKELSVVGPGQLHLVTRFGQNSGTVKPIEVLEALLPEVPVAHMVRRIRKVGSVFEAAPTK